MTTTLNRPQAARRTRQLSLAAPAHGEVRVGPVNDLCADEVLALVSALPLVAGLPQRKKGAPVQGAAAILRWLQRYPGDGWQERWLSAGADRDTRWLDDVVADDSRTAATKRSMMTHGLACLLLVRIVLPSYGFLSQYRARSLFTWARQVVQPDLFARLEQAGATQGMQAPQLRDGITVLTRIVLHTGKNLDEITGADLHEHREYFYGGLRVAGRGVHAAWQLLAAVGVLPAESSMRADTRLGQRTVEELVDYHGLRCRPIRDVIVRYLNERGPSLDHGSLRGLAATLAGRFWADIERHHPNLDTLKLPADVAEQWKQRLRYVTATDGTQQMRKDYLVQLGRVRSFYLDLQEWALEDPLWAAWAMPSPVRRTELAGMSKARRKTVAEMHQRVRERLPHLPRLADSADNHRTDQAKLLVAAKAVPVGETFVHGDTTYLRTNYKSYARDPKRQKESTVLVENAATGEQVNIADTEDDAFWTWAIIETFRHTGIRVEELLEITQLAIVSYRLAGTGEVVPLLQIVPSKSNEERLLLISPELAAVLASIVKRLRDGNSGAIPLVARYDHIEKITGPPLPHLFQRRQGTQPSVISPTQVKRILTDAIARADIVDIAGRPLRYTPHDFRRLFTTEAVTGGLPVHIAAKLLGHQNLATVESYLAVFQDDLVRTYRSFLDRRRALRPESEYREPTEEEWREFEQHFHQRKLGLGTCGRPYGTPCQHEHACVRCPVLRVDPEQRHRLVEIIRNLNDRITEARLNGWLGEVEGLNASLNAATAKLVALDRSTERTRGNNSSGPTSIGMPVLARPADPRHR